MSDEPVGTVAPEDHLDDDVLVERALAGGGEDVPVAPGARSPYEAGDEPPDDAAAHLAACPSCRARFASLRRVVVAARLDGPGEDVAAPDRVWSAITAELGVGQRPSRDDEPVHDRPAPAVTALGRRRRSARRTAPWMLAAAGAGGLLLGWVIGHGTAGPTPAPSVASAPTTSQEPPVTVLASARLDPLLTDDAATAAVPAPGAGRAELDERGGGRTLVVSADGLRASSSATAAGGNGGYYEVWLIDLPEGRLVSLGVLGASRGSFTLPPEIDTGAFSTVDVSFEPLDGEPAHSGASVLRGTLAPNT